MKIEEILSVPQPPPRLDVTAFDFTTGEQITTIENHPVWLHKAIQNPNVELYVVKQETTNQLVAYVVGTDIQLSAATYFLVTDARTVTSYQKQGFMTALYSMLIQRKKRLISDKKQSPPMQKIWRAANKVYDTTSGTILDRNDVPEENIYTTDKEGASKYRLIFENLQPNYFPEVSMKGILRDYSIYTHEENIGKYE